MDAKRTSCPPCVDWTESDWKTLATADRLAARGLEVTRLQRSRPYSRNEEF